MEREGGAAGRAGAGEPDPQRALSHDADELEQRIDELGEHIEGSREELRARREDADVARDVAGTWRDTEDEAGGEDPATFDDPDRIDGDEEDDRY